MRDIVLFGVVSERRRRRRKRKRRRRNRNRNRIGRRKRQRGRTNLLNLFEFVEEYELIGFEVHF
jgi:hypothetical protein